MGNIWQITLVHADNAAAIRVLAHYQNIIYTCQWLKAKYTYCNCCISILFPIPTKQEAKKLRGFVLVPIYLHMYILYRIEGYFCGVLMYVGAPRIMKFRTTNIFNPSPPAIAQWPCTRSCVMCEWTSWEQGFDSSLRYLHNTKELYHTTIYIELPHWTTCTVYGLCKRS